MSHGNFSFNWPSIYDEDLNIIPSVAENYPMPKDVAKMISEQGEDATLAKDIPSTERVTQTILLSSPRPNQHIIAKGRDFYVTGRFAGVGIIPEDAVLTVEIMDSDRNVVRKVSCFHKDDKEHLFLDPVQNNTLEWYTPEIPPTKYDKPKKPSLTPEESRKLLFEIAENSCMPDYVCSTDILPEGINQPVTPKEAVKYTWNKAYYTDTFFAALIYGGEYGKAGTFYEDELIRTTDVNGNEILPIEEGDYTLLITLRSKKEHGYIISRFKDAITIGDIPNKIMGAFSYPEHRQYLFDREEETNQIMFWDPFPGVWTSNLLFGANYLRLIKKEEKTEEGQKTVYEKEKKPLFFFYGNKKRAAFNDSVEYRGGTIHFYDYGVMSTSAALNLEMAEVIKQRAAGKKIDVITYYYANGEYNIASLYDVDPPEPDSYKWAELSPIIRKDDSFIFEKFPTEYRQFNEEYGFSDIAPLIAFTRVETDIDDSFEEEENYYDTTKIYSIEGIRNIPRSFRIPGTYQYSLRIPVGTNNRIALYGVSSIPKQELPLEEKDEYGRALDVDRVVEITYCVYCDCFGGNGFKRVTKPLGLVRKVPSVRNPEEFIYKNGLLEFRHVFDLKDIVPIWEEKPYVYICVEKIKLLREKPDGKQFISINNPEYIVEPRSHRTICTYCNQR